ncbi:ABC transporter substrate-binding protein [Variovorax sp. J22P168]|uniref:ABC transporter substrate-binding protein n=1 Tax=Variovorax jilinensis TaxID=3053513 RepID=UPI0025791F4F|nr:ABC transporter substrate-binding protein [Variovorax sp. J22P168]MDM0015140.1 ABC transporter substrate-binding protein [Variovorax sp. J22P168]
MVNFARRTITAGIGAAAVLGPLAVRAQGTKPDIVIAGAQPLTGLFSFAGVASDLGLAEYCNWRNANGGVLGHKLKYVSEDTSYKVDVGVPVVKKMMAEYKPSFFFVDGTGLGKATARDLIEAGTVMVTSTSCAQALVDPVSMPHYFSTGPTYPLMQEILMEYIASTAKGSAKKPTVAYVYSELEFGREGIPAGKARAEKLGLPIVAEIVTKPAGVDVSGEVAKLRRAKPDFVIFQGYVLAPIPEFIRQMREAGLTSQVVGTTYSMDIPTYQAIGALGEKWTGLFPYRYAYDKEATMARTMREQITKAKPDLKDISIFTIQAWLSGMIFAEIAERCIKAGKPLNLANMKVALESIKNWDSGGLIGLPVDLSLHRIATGRMYSYNAGTKQMDPISDWIQV